MEAKTLIALPVYNEARHLPNVLAKLVPFKERVVFVNDGSTDTSSELIRSAGYDVVDFPVNLGLSAVYRAVFTYASVYNYSKVIFLDSDGQHEIEHISAFETQLRNKRLVCGSRFANPDTVPTAKIASNLFAVLLLKEITGVMLPDVACGFRAINKGDDWPMIGGAYGFEVIYNMLLNSCLRMECPLFVKINPIYEHHSIYYTRKQEVESLLNATVRHDRNGIIANFKKQLAQEQDLVGSLSGFDFIAKRHNGNYIFETDDRKARDLFIETNSAY